MAQSKAATVEAYLAELPLERREVLAHVRALIRARLPEGYVESMRWGVISYEIPLSTFPDTYNKQPLSYVGLAAQKHHFALYLMCVYGHAGMRLELEEAFRTAGLKLDMGKSCVRFRTLRDLPLDALGALIARVTPERYIAFYEAARASSARQRG